MSWKIALDPAYQAYHRLYITVAGEVWIVALTNLDEEGYDPDRFLSGYRFASDWDAKEFVRQALTNHVRKIEPHIRDELSRLVDLVTPGGYLDYLDNL